MFIGGSADPIEVVGSGACSFCEIAIHRTPAMTYHDRAWHKEIRIHRKVTHDGILFYLYNCVKIPRASSVRFPSSAWRGPLSWRAWHHHSELNHC